MQEITVEALRDLLQGSTPPVLIDVREPAETAQGMLPGAIQMPLATLPEHVDALSPTQPTVIYCHHGGRSARAVQFLQQAGFADVSNLVGGTDAWSRRIDPSLPIY